MDLKKILEKAFDAGYDTSLMYNNLGDEAYKDFQEFYKKEVTEQLSLTDVVTSLPEIEDVNFHLKHRDNKLYNKNESLRTAYELGVRNNFYWMRKEINS